VKIILHWLKTNRVMLINAGSLFGTTVVTSVLGFVYWWVAARRFTPEAVGVGSAAISSMTLLGLFCMLGLGTVLVTEIPRQPKQALSLTSTSLMVVFIAGGLAGLLFATVAPLFSHEFSSLNADIFEVLLFALGVGLTSVSLVLDQALVAFLRGTKQFQRNAFFSVSKLVFLALISFLFSNLTGMSIYATWALGNLLSVIFVLLPIVLKSKRSLRNYLPVWKLLRQMSGVALRHHLLNTLLQLTPYALPLIVTTLLSAKVNALFYVSWMSVSFVICISVALTSILHAMNSAHKSNLVQNARLTMSLAFILIGLVVIILQCVAQQVLGVFGTAYLDGVWTLRILLLAAFPLIIKDHYITICRIQDRLKQAMWIIAPSCLLELMLTVLGARLGGLPGLSLGWLLAGCVEAIWMSPVVYKTVFAVKSPAVACEESSKETTKENVWLPEPVIWSDINTGPLPYIPFPCREEMELYNQSQQECPKQSHRFKPLRLECFASSSPSLWNAVVAGNGDPGKMRYQFKSLHFQSLASLSPLSYRDWVVVRNGDPGKKQYQFKSLYFKP
jgi:O-antigen/teichoic acid export membrane protein